MTGKKKVPFVNNSSVILSENLVQGKWINSVYFIVHADSTVERKLFSCYKNTLKYHTCSKIP